MNGTAPPAANPLLGMLFDYSGQMAVGLVLIAVAAVIFYVRSKAEPDSRRTLAVLAGVIGGCGGCLVMAPLMMIASAVLMVGGIVAFCNQSASC